MHPRFVAWHAQFGVHSSNPMDLQAMLGRLLYTVNHNLLDHRTQNPLL
jgi:hypothetical protein